MAKNFWAVTDLAGNVIPPVSFPVAAAGVATIRAGDPVTITANNMIGVSTGATSFAGIAAGPSDETAAAAGTVLVYRAPMLKFSAFATTPGNLAAGTLLTKVTLDVSGENFTIDEDDTVSGFVEIEKQVSTTTGECVCVAACTL